MYVTDCPDGTYGNGDICYQPGDDELGDCPDGHICVHRFHESWPGVCCTGNCINNALC